MSEEPAAKPRPGNEAEIAESGTGSPSALQLSQLGVCKCPAVLALLSYPGHLPYRLQNATTALPRSM